MIYEIPFQNYQSIFEYMQKNNDKDNQDDFVDRIFSDKAKTQKTIVKNLLNEINLRKELHKNLLTKINEEIITCDTYLLNIPNRNYYLDTDINNINKRRSHIEDKIIQLEQEKRLEDLKYWEDMKDLYKDLLIAFNEYWLAFRKKEFLNIAGNENL